MNSLLIKFLSSRRLEYLTVDRDFTILETSFGAPQLADCPNEVIPGNDVRLGFPELIGLEDVLIDIIEGRQISFNLEGIARCSEPNALYIDISFMGNESENFIIILENVTPKMVWAQELLQRANEANLLASALADSKAYIEKLINSINEALLVTTQSGKIKTTNRATQALFGYRESELQGQQISQIINDETFLGKASQQNPFYCDLLKNEEVICHTQTGEKRSVAFSCSVIQTNTDDLQDFVYIGRDITERKRIEEELHGVTRLQKAILDSANYTIISTDSDGIIQTFNSAAERLLGYTAEEVVGKATPAILHNPDEVVQRVQVLSTELGIEIEPNFEVFVAKARQGIPDENEWTYIRKDGSRFPVRLSVTALYDEQGNIRGYLGIGSDITLAKQAEAALKESEERYRDLFENAKDLIQSVTADGRFVYVNRAWRSTLGYNEADIAKMTIFDVIHPNSQPHCMEVFQQVMSGKKIDRIETQFLTKDGKTIWLEGNINCNFVEGKPVTTRAIFRDITKRIKAQAALRREQKQTERLLLNILPAAIADRLKQQPGTIADEFAEVTVMFADIVGFTELSAQTSPTQLVGLLNAIFSEFDRLAELHGLEKIKTIGDAYMVVGGLPVPQKNHAQAIAEMALDMQAAIADFCNKIGKALSIRIGINTGPVVAGVIGIKKFSYDLWGDTVNTASRMESHGLAGQIQVSAATYEHLREHYLLKKRGTIQVKGKGEMTTYFLIGRKG